MHKLKKNNSKRGDARLIIGASVACNLHCKFCVFGDFRNEFVELPTKEILAALKRYAKLCDRVAFTGGEPTLRQDLPEIVRSAKSLGYRVILQSNGRMYAYRDLCRSLIDCGVDDFHLSLSAHSSKLYDSLAMTKGSFPEVIAGITNLVSLGQSVSVNTVVNAYNVSSLEKIAKLLVRLGVKDGQFSLIRKIPDSKGVFRKGYFTRNSAPKAIRQIFKAVDIFNKAGLVSRIQMIPPCHLPGYEKYYGKYLGKTKNIVIPPRTKGGRKVHINIGEQVVFCKCNGCKACIYNSSCEGIAEFAPFSPRPVLKKRL